MFSAKLWLSPKYSHIKPDLKCGSSSKLKMFVLLSASFLIWTTVVAAEEQIDKRPRMNFTLWLSSSFCLTNSVTPKENYYRFISEKSFFFLSLLFLLLEMTQRLIFLQKCKQLTNYCYSTAVQVEELLIQHQLTYTLVQVERYTALKQLLLWINKLGRTPWQIGILGLTKPLSGQSELRNWTKPSCDFIQAVERGERGRRGSHFWLLGPKQLQLTPWQLDKGKSWRVGLRAQHSTGHTTAEWTKNDLGLFCWSTERFCDLFHWAFLLFQFEVISFQHGRHLVGQS